MGQTDSRFQVNYDVIKSGHEYMKEEDFEVPTGWEGVKAILNKDKQGLFSPQLAMVIQGVQTAGFFGVLIGGAIHSQATYHNFIRNNMVTKFDNIHTARRSLYDSCFLSFGKGAFRWGWRMSAFTGSFILISAIIPAYRGKHSMFDWTASCMLSGGLYKFQSGPKPMVAGAVLGALMGTVAGAVVESTLKITGLTMEDIYDTKKAALLRSLEEKNKKFEEERERLAKERVEQFSVPTVE